MTTLHHLVRRGQRIALRRAAPGPIYLVSAGGQPNYGDEFITRAWLKFLARKHPRVDVWLDSPEPGRAAHIFRAAHPRLHTTNTLWQLSQLPEEAGPCGFPLIDQVMRAGGSPKIDLGLAALREMRSIHLLGGGYVSSLWPRHLGLVMGAVAAKRQFGVPVYVTGQGWLPQDDDARGWLRGVRDCLDFGEARDAGSAREFELDLGVDDAYLHFAQRAERLYSEDSPDIMLLVQGDLVEKLGREASVEILDAFLRSHGGSRSVGVVEAIPPEDSWLVEDIRRLAPAVEFFPFDRIWRDGFPAREGQKWLATRFHAHLVAAAGGAEGTVFSAVPGYYDVKHELLLENGTGWAYARSMDGLAKAVPAPTRNTDFPELARALAAEKLAVANRLYPQV